MYVSTMIILYEQSQSLAVLALVRIASLAVSAVMVPALAMHMQAHTRMLAVPIGISIHTT